LLAFGAWEAAGLAVFFLGWPWLWYDTAHRLTQFVGTGVERAEIHVQYFGKVYADHDVPWHYPWFYFAVTVPVGLHLLGLLGLVRGWKLRKGDPFPLLAGSRLLGLLGFFRGWKLHRGDPFPLLLAGSIVLFLAVFSTT